jgi:hypothetical protein
MKIKNINNNETAIEFLTTFKPEWIDEMPVATSTYTPGKCNLIQDVHYDKTKRQGVLALYFGAGCKKGDDGWYLLAVSDATEDEFNAIAVPFAVLTALKMGIPPSSLFAAA